MVASRSDAINVIECPVPACSASFHKFRAFVKHVKISHESSHSSVNKVILGSSSHSSPRHHPYSHPSSHLPTPLPEPKDLVSVSPIASVQILSLEPPMHSPEPMECDNHSSNIQSWCFPVFILFSQS